MSSTSGEMPTRDLADVISVRLTAPRPGQTITAQYLTDPMQREARRQRLLRLGVRP